MERQRTVEVIVEQAKRLFPNITENNYADLLIWTMQKMSEMKELRGSEKKQMTLQILEELKKDDKVGAVLVQISNSTIDLIIDIEKGKVKVDPKSLSFWKRIATCICSQS